MLRPALLAYDRGVTTEVSRERVTPEELEVWRSFLRAQALIVRRLEADLMDRHGMPLAWYDVLARLVESNGHRLRIFEVGISYYGRTYEEGKKIGWKDGVRALWCIVRYNCFR